MWWVVSEWKKALPIFHFSIAQLSTFMKTHFEIKDKRTTSVSTRKFDLDGDDFQCSAHYFPALTLLVHFLRRAQENDGQVEHK